MRIYKSKYVFSVVYKRSSDKLRVKRIMGMNTLKLFLLNNLKAITDQEQVDYSMLPEELHEDFYDFSVAHNLQLLVYESYRNSIVDSLSPAILSKWKIEYLRSSMTSKMLFYNSRKVFHELYDNDIKVIVFKGISYSRYYINPITRLMGDIDIIVEPDNYDETVNILEKIGYVCANKGIKSHHLIFEKKDAFNIELHHSIVDCEKHPQFKSLNDICLHSVMECKQDGILFYHPTVSDELKMCLGHMYKHYCSTGFGYKMLIDFYLILRKASYEGILEFSKESHIYNFTLLVLRLMRDYFQLVFSIEIDEQLNEIDPTVLDLFTQDIHMSGAFGYKDRSMSLSKSLSNISHNHEKSIFIRNLRYLFPNTEYFSRGPNYKYCQSTKILLPVAWVHRIVRGIWVGRVKLTTRNIDNKVIIDRMKVMDWVLEQ